MPKMGRRALFCYNKARNKERKKGDALRKRFGDFRQEGDTNGLKTGGIQK